MNLSEFIGDAVFRPRLKQSGCLVVYDAQRRYREVCLNLGADKVRVVDAILGEEEWGISIRNMVKAARRS